MEETLINAEDCKKILKTFSNNARFFSYSVKSLVGHVEGYLSTHFSLTIRYIDSEDKSQKEVFFMKKQSNHPGFLPELAKTLDAFNKENFVYTLCSELEKMKNFQPFAPKCYFMKDDLLVIENLDNQNYYIAERNVLYNLEECKVSLKTLALYHSACIAYEEQKSAENGKLFRLNLEYPKEFEDKFYSSDKSTAVYKFFEASIQLMLDLVDIVPDETIDKRALKELILEETQDPNKMDYMRRFRLCCLHSDLWSKNIMFKKTENKITDCRLIDFQLLRYFLPGFDVVLFLSANTSYKFRQIHKEELFQYYYDCLDTQLEEYGVNCSKIVPYQDLIDGALISEPAAKIQAFNDSALMRLPDTLLEEAMAKPELFREILIEKRSVYILDLYHQNPEFRTMVLEEILELNEALEQKQYYVNNNTLL